MWYFTWVLGLGLAVGFGILNGIWYEYHLSDEETRATAAAGEE